MRDRLTRVERLAGRGKWNCTYRLHEGRSHKLETSSAAQLFCSGMAQSKIGRNDPCGCGSGEKFKKCCLDRRPNVISLPGGERRRPTLPPGLTLREINPNTPE